MARVDIASGAGHGEAFWHRNRQELIITVTAVDQGHGCTGKIGRILTLVAAVCVGNAECWGHQRNIWPFFDEGSREVDGYSTITRIEINDRALVVDQDNWDGDDHSVACKRVVRHDELDRAVFRARFRVGSDVLDRFKCKLVLLNGVCPGELEHPGRVIVRVADSRRRGDSKAFVQVLQRQVREAHGGARDHKHRMIVQVRQVQVPPENGYV